MIARERERERETFRVHAELVSTLWSGDVGTTSVQKRSYSKRHLLQTCQGISVVFQKKNEI